MSTASQQRDNPFPGLRPFRSDEHHLFFGREEQTAALLQLLRQNRFLAVVGTSGSGKSSLVRAGLIAELHGGTMTHAGSTWEVMILRPGGSPIENLTRAMVDADLYDADDPSTLPRLKATLSRSRFGLVEAMKQSDVFDPGTNLLVVVDQFEELFRFRQQGVDSEETATAFVNLLLTASQQSECPIYVAITMRSDYLGDCSEIPGLAEAVNEGEYLIPRLMRDQKRDAIEKPIGVGGAKVSPLLVQRLLNDVGDDPDQLPVLQHALMRMWDVWATGSDHTRPIHLSDFEATGGLASALSNHADEIYDSLPDDRHRSACERIFKTLTEKGDDNRGIRRPTRLATLEAIASANRETVTVVLDAFRQGGVTFLMPGTEMELGDRTVLDLSHESLMRGWQRLRSWVEDEAQSARIFRRLLDTAYLWRDGKAGLFRDPDLQISLSWREAESPNSQWAEQYGGNFETAIHFLETSNAEAEAERQAKEAARQRELEQAQQLAEAERQRATDQARAAVRLRGLVRGLAVVALFALAASVLAWFARQEAKRNAEVAAQKATDAEEQQKIAERARQDTEVALAEVQKKKEEAEAAEMAARLAESQAKEKEAEAELQRTAAFKAQASTQQALTEVASAKELAEKNLKAAVVAEEEALAAEAAAVAAEKRSRAFRYSTDIQLAGRLIEDKDTTARKIFDRLGDHDPAKNAELNDDEDLRGFEWFYLSRMANGPATVLRGFDKRVIDAVLTPENELVTLDEDAVLKRLNVETRLESQPQLNLKKGRTVAAMALSPDASRVALVSGNKTLVLDAATGKEIFPPLPSPAKNGLLFSPDSRMLVTVDTQVGWWDASSGKPIALETSNLEDSSGLLAQGMRWSGLLSLSSDGLILAVGGQSTKFLSSSFSVFRMNPETREVRILLDKKEGDIGTIRSVKISPDGESVFATSYYSGNLTRFDVATGKPANSNSTEHAASVSHMAFNAEGTELVTGSLDGMIKVWKDYRQLVSPETDGLMGHAGEVDLVTFIDGGKRLVSANRDKTIRIWDRDGKSSSLSYPLDGVTTGDQAVFSPDGLLVACADRRQLQLWNAATGQLVRTFKREGEGVVYSLAFSPDGRLLAAGFGAEQTATKGVSLVELWDIDRGERLAVMPGALDIAGFSSFVNDNVVSGLAFSPDGSRLVASFGSPNSYPTTNTTSYPLKVYDVDSRRTIRVLKGHLSHCITLAFSPDGSRLVSGSFDGTARVWDTASWKTVQVLNNPDPRTPQGAQRVHDVSFSCNGKHLAMASAEGTAVIWDTVTWEHVQTLRGHGNSVHAVAFSPDGRTLATGSQDQTVRLWNTTTWRDMAQLTPEGSINPTSLAFSPDGRRLMVTGKGALVWSTRSDDESAVQALAVELNNLLKSKTDFRSRIRMLSDTPHLQEALAKLIDQHPDNQMLQTSLAAAQLNSHAVRQQWTQAVERFDRLRELSSDKPEDWLRTSGLLRLATALLHEDRPAEAAALLTGGEKRRAEDGNGTRVTGFGYVATPVEYPIKLESVVRGSPAWRGGLREGDLLLKINDIEITAETNSQYTELIKGPAGTKVTMTIQHAGHDEPETIEMTKASHIQDDATNLLIEELLAALDQKLVDTADRSELFELHAEIAGQSSEYERQVADYTAATDALSVLPEVEAAADLARLHRRRGNAFIGLKLWQRAHDDYAQGITSETTDEDVLTNQARARYYVHLVENRDTLDHVWFDDATPPGAQLLGDTPWEFVTRPVHPVFSGEKSFRRQAKGMSQHYFKEASPGLEIREGDLLFVYVYLEPQDPPKTLMLQFNAGDWSHRAFWGEDLIELGTGNDEDHLSMGPLPKAGQWVRLEVEARKVGLRSGAVLNGWAMSQFDGTCYWDRAGTSGLGRTFTTPWEQLAAVYRATDNQQAIGQLLESRPQAVGVIGDLYSQDKDWQRAVEIYSRGIRPETTNEELLGKRAQAYEELKDWNAAAADWSRAAGERPEGAKLVADFASRLVKAEQYALAATQRERSRAILEAILRTDPGDTPAIDDLAALLLDMSTSTEDMTWTVLNPAKVTPATGSRLVAQADGTWLVEEYEDTVAFAELAAGVKAIRIETAHASPSAETTTPAFKDYRIESVGAHRSDSGALLGRYVRIDLPGDNSLFPRRPQDGNDKMINLAELQVFQGARNIALRKAARQSSGDGEGHAAYRAVDGDTVGRDGSNPYAHTWANLDGNNPWWEVDLGSEQAIDRLAVWIREGYETRMNHFRVRVLDASRNIVLEQVIDQAPNPSREIDGRSLLTAKTPESDADTPRWTLRLDENSGVSPGGRFRISSTQVLPGLAHEEAIAEAQLPVARLAAAYHLNSETSSSADWFCRALDNADNGDQRKRILTLLQDHSRALSQLLEDRPDDLDLQLALARSHVKAGWKHLTNEQPAEAIAEFQQAADSFTRLLNQTSAPNWHVLKPIEMSTETSAQLQPQDDDSVLVLDPQGNDTFSVTFETTLPGITGLRLETLADSRLPGGGPGTSHDGNFVLSEISLRVAPADHSEPARTIRLLKAAADFSQEISGNYDVSTSIDGSGLTGWAIHPQIRQDHVAVFETAEKIGDGQSARLTVRLTHQDIPARMLVGRFRVSVTTDSMPATTSNLRFNLTNGELAGLDVSMGKALAQQDKLNEAVAAFARALGRVEKDDERKQLIVQIQENQAALTILAEQRPQDPALQLALAKSLAESGKKALAEDRQDEALPQLARASAVFAGLLDEQVESTWVVLQPIEMTAESGANMEWQQDGSIFVANPAGSVETYTLVFETDLQGIEGLRLEALADSRLPNGGPGWASNDGNFVLNELSLQAAPADSPDDPESITLQNATADFSQSSWDVRGAVDGDATTGWAISPQLGRDHTAIFDLAGQVGDGQSTRLTVRFRHQYTVAEKRTLGRFRLAFTTDGATLRATRNQLIVESSELADLYTSLGSAHGSRGQVVESSTAYSNALDLATDREARTTILKTASAHDGVLNKLAELRNADATFHDSLARHHHVTGNFAAAYEAAATARTLYEQQLAHEPANSKLAKDLADLLLDVRSPKAFVRVGTQNQLNGIELLTYPADGVTKPEILNGVDCRFIEIGREGVGYAYFKLQDDVNWSAGMDADISVSYWDEGSGRSAIQFDSADATYKSSENRIELTNSRSWKSARFVLKNARLAGNQNGGAGFRLYVQKQNLRFRLVRLMEVHPGERSDNSWVRLGSARLSLGESDTAFDMFARAVDQAGTNQARAELAQEMAAFDEVFAKLQERFPDDESLRLGRAKYLAAQHIAESQFQSAVEVLSRILADFPDDIELLNQRAGAHMKLADWKAADADYSRVIELESDDGKRHMAELVRAECWLRMGQFEQGAEVHFQEMLLSPADYFRVHNAGASLMLAGQHGMAKVVASRAYEKFNATKISGQANWLVRAFTVQPDLVTKDNSQKLLELAKTAGGSWTQPMTAAIHYRLGDLKLAEPLLTTSKDKPQFEALAAMLLYDQGKTDEARSFLREGPEAWFERERAKDPASAIPAQQAWQEWGVRIAVWREAARKLIGPRITELDALLAMEPDRSAELMERVGLLAEAGLHEEALLDLERLVALKVDSVELHTLHGRVLAALRRDEEALAHLNLAIEAGSQDAAVYAARGTILLEQGQSAAAEIDLKRSLTIDFNEDAARSMTELLLAQVAKVVNWQVLQPVEFKSKSGATLTLLEDGSVLASGENPTRDTYTLTYHTDLKTIAAFRLEALTDNSLPRLGPGRGAGGTFDIRWKFTATKLADDTVRSLRIRAAVADFSNDKIPITADSWNIEGGQGLSHTAFLALDAPLQADDGVQVTLTIEGPKGGRTGDQNLGHFRLSVADHPNAFDFERHRLAPWNSAVYAMLGREAEFAEIVEANPKFIRAIADASSDLTEWERALKLYDQLVTPETTDTGLLTRRAEAFGHLQRWDAAHADWKRILELKPEDEPLRQRWVDALSAGEQWPELAAHYSKILDALPPGRKPKQPRDQLLESIIRRRDGLFAALRIQRPEDSLIRVSIARDAVLRNDWKTAAAAYLEGIDDAAEPDEWYECAAALLLAGRQDEYKTFLNRIVVQISSKADEALVSYALARTAAISPDENIPWPQVIAWAEHAAKEDVAWFWHATGLAHLRAGNSDQALAWLEKSASTNWHPELNQLALALVHHQLGNKVKASELLQQAQKWLADREANRIGDYYDARVTDWLEFHIFLPEASAAIDGKPDTE